MLNCISLNNGKMVSEIVTLTYFNILLLARKIHFNYLTDEIYISLERTQIR